MAAAAALIGIASSIGGTILSSQAAKQQGEEARVAAETQALQQEKQAKAEIANASREAAVRYKQEQTLLSNQQAIAAASGGGASDPSVLDLAGDAAAYGYEQGQGIIANGRNVANGYLDQAIASRRTGQSALRAARLNSRATILSGLTTAGQQFAGLMPKPGVK